jgi:hypothetical protein
VLVGIFGLLVVAVGAVAAVVLSLGNQGTTPPTQLATVMPTPSSDIPGAKQPVEVPATKSGGAPKPKLVPPKLVPPKPIPPKQVPPKPTPTVVAVVPPELEPTPTPTVDPTPTPTPTEWPDLSRLALPGRVVMRVACGADRGFTDGSGYQWLPDQVFGGGKTWGHTGGAGARHNPPREFDVKAAQIYASQQFGTMKYQFKLKAGKYALRLHFCETYEPFFAGSGKRVFDVKVQGQTLIADLDPCKDGGGGWKPVVREFKGIAVTDGTLLIEFVTKKDNAEINGIEIFAE